MDADEEKNERILSAIEAEGIAKQIWSAPEGEKIAIVPGFKEPPTEREREKIGREVGEEIAKLLVEQTKGMFKALNNRRTQR